MRQERNRHRHPQVNGVAFASDGDVGSGSDGDDEPVTWAAVAATTGRTVHALAQWHAVVDAPDIVNFGESRWPYGAPSTGSLDEEALSPLLNVLAAHTTTADDCFYGLWEGWGWIYGSPAIQHTHFRDGLFRRLATRFSRR